MYKITNDTSAIIANSLTEARKLADLSATQTSKLFQGRIIHTDSGLSVRKVA